MRNLLLLFGCLLLSCQRELTPEKVQGYDVFLIAGQSNTHAGYGLNFAFDKPDKRIVQLGRKGADNMLIIPAIEPLQHHTAADSFIGFSLSFAKLYADELLQPGRKVLIIPCGYNATGFSTGHWNRGQPLYRDAINRVIYCVQTLPDAKIKAILWHQGESDAHFGLAYKGALDAMIKNMRTDLLSATQESNISFIAGGLVPYWVKIHNPSALIDSILRDLPNRIIATAFADPNHPFVIRKQNDALDAIHFDAAGQREMGKRYFTAYKSLR